MAAILQEAACPLTAESELITSNGFEGGDEGDVQKCSGEHKRECLDVHINSPAPHTMQSKRNANDDDVERESEICGGSPNLNNRESMSESKKNDSVGNACKRAITADEGPSYDPYTNFNAKRSQESHSETTNKISELEGNVHTQPNLQHDGNDKKYQSHNKHELVNANESCDKTLTKNCYELNATNMRKSEWGSENNEHSSYRRSLGDFGSNDEGNQQQKQLALHEFAAYYQDQNYQNPPQHQYHDQHVNAENIKLLTHNRQEYPQTQDVLGNVYNQQAYCNEQYLSSPNPAQTTQQLHQQQYQQDNYIGNYEHQQQQQHLQHPQQHHHLPMASTPEKSSGQCSTRPGKGTNVPLTAVDDFLIDEYREDPNAAYKLCISPVANAKQENQDDGYETSAGDVLTPNSHSSSTHSSTPQHIIQHSTGMLMPNQSNPNLHLLKQQQQSQQPRNNEEILTEKQGNTRKESNMGGCDLPLDTYNFMDNNNINLMSPRHHSGIDLGVGSSHMEMENSFGSTHEKSENLGGNKDAANNSERAAGPPTHESNLNFMDCNDTAIMKPPPKRRGRKKKAAAGGDCSIVTGPNSSNTNTARPKERRRHDRFNGMSEEEVCKRTIPDHLSENLDIVIVGINPGLFAAYKGHHYAGPGNHFWKCLYLSGLTQEQMCADEDYKLLKYGIGFTNMVERPTKGSADLTRKEIKEGSQTLLEKLKRFQPKIAVFNGKLIYEVFSGKKDFNFGRQPECVEGTETHIWVMPSSSARCAQLPRAADKVPFYAALKKFRDYLNGLIPHMEEAECVFTDQRIKEYCMQENARDSSAQQQARSSSGIGGGIEGIRDHAIEREAANHPEQQSRGVEKSECIGEPSFVSSTHYYVPAHSEKKKRGRPKKVKVQECIDPLTGNKIPMEGNRIKDGHDFANILNLSVVGGGSSLEMPKKKRGRPKKIKLPPDLESSYGQSGIPALVTKKQNHSSQQHQQVLHSHHTSLYGASSPMMHSSGIYSNVSPSMDPSVVNCSYTGQSPGTPAELLHSNITQHRVVACSENNNSYFYNGRGDISSKLKPRPTGSCGLGVNEKLSMIEPTTSSTSPNIGANDYESSPAILNNNNDNQMMQKLDFPYISDTNKGVTEQQQKQEQQQQMESSSPYRQWLPLLGSQHSDNTEPTHFYDAPKVTFSHYNAHTLYPPEAVPSALENQAENQQLEKRQSAWTTQRYESQQQHHPQTTFSTNESQSQSQQQHQNSNSVTSDIATKSLSGLESLVDQIPANSERDSHEISTATTTSNSLALERRLREFQCQDIRNELLTNDTLNGAASCSGSGSENRTPHSLISMYNQEESSPDNYNIQKQSATPSQHQSYTQSSTLTATSSPVSSVTTTEIATDSPTNINLVVPATNENNTTNTYGETNGNNNPPYPGNTAAANLHTSNFSVNNLVAQSNDRCNNDSYDTASGTASSQSLSAYHHHSNFMAAAALAAAVNSSSSAPTHPHQFAHHHQMYMDTRHAHMPHLPVNTMYGTAAPPPPPHHHPQHHSTYHMHNAYVGPSQHAAMGCDYGTASYGENTGVHSNNGGSAHHHTLHVPSPNYPYGYSAPSGPHSYPHAAAAAAAAVAGYHTHHAHPRHLSMFDRLKSSDIGSYGGF